jgi:hypothetical protein
MFRFLLSVVAMLALTAAVASPSQGNETPAVTVIQDTPHDVPFLAEGEVPTKADAEFGVLYAEGRITKLPQDAHKFYVTIFGSLKDQKYKDIVSWFETNDQLKNYKSQTHFGKIDTTMKIYGERYEKTVPALPCIRVQQADGKTLFQASGKNVPVSAEALAKGMSTECIFRWRRNRPQPQPSPDDDDAPNPDTDGDEDEDDDGGPQPDVIKGPQPDKVSPADDNHTQIVLGILVAVFAGLALGGAHGFTEKLHATRANR